MLRDYADTLNEPTSSTWHICEIELYFSLGVVVLDDCSIYVVF